MVMWRHLAVATIASVAAATWSALPSAADLRQVELPTAQWKAGTPSCQIQNDAITELSGIAASQLAIGGWYVHNDSGDGPNAYLVDENCRTRATLRVAGTVAFDWEDASSTTLPDGRPSVMFADIGDNLTVRNTIRVVEIAEPSQLVDADQLAIDVVPYATYRISYPNDRHNAEALFVTPDRHLGIITKSESGKATVYLSADAASDAQQTLQLVGVASLDLTERWPSSPAPGARQLQVTAADMTPDGTLLVIRTTARAWVWRVPGDVPTDVEGDAWSQAMRQAPLTTIEFPQMTQAEAIAFDANGTNIVSASEGSRPQLMLARGSTPHGRVASTPTATAPPDSSTTSPTSDVPVMQVPTGQTVGWANYQPWSWTPLVVTVCVAFVASAALGLGAVVRRRGGRRD